MHRATPIAIITLLAACGGDEPQVAAPTTEERLAMAPDAANGRRLFRACATCHEAAKGTGHRVGPNLWGVVGAPAGRFEDFSYSRALRRWRIVWTEAALDAYLEEPQSVIPGGRMSYPGEPDPADRRDLIAYLSTLEDAGAE